MTQFSCPHCNHSLPNRGLYCPDCGLQVKCSKCGDLLEALAIACVMCGTRVTSTPREIGETVTTSGNAANSVQFVETAKKRSLNASFTNDAVESLAGPLGMFLSGRLSAIDRAHSQPSGSVVETNGSQQLMLPESGPSSTDSEDEILECEVAVEPRAVDSLVDVSGKQHDIWKVFIQREDRLILEASRLKATNRADAVRRLTYLYLIAREAMGIHEVAKEELKTLAQTHDLHDTNWHKVFDDSTNLRLEDEMVALRGPGRDQGNRYLQDVLDETVSDEWPLSNARMSKNTRPSAKNDRPEKSKGQTRTGTRKARITKAQHHVQTWQEFDGKVDGHSIVKGSSTAQKAMFGLWAIRKSAGDSGKDVSSNVLAEFLMDACEVKVNERTLRRMLVESQEVQGRVMKISGATFRITQSGMDYIDNLIALSGPVDNTAVVVSDED